MAELTNLAAHQRRARHCNGAENRSVSPPAVPAAPLSPVLVTVRAPTRTLLPQPPGAARPWEDVYIDEFFAKKGEDRRRLPIKVLPVPDVRKEPVQACTPLPPQTPSCTGELPAAAIGIATGLGLVVDEEQAVSSGPSLASVEEQGLPMPPAGACKHTNGDCRRCNFFAKGRCRNGLDCLFCHLPHDRRKLSRQEKREAQVARMQCQQQQTLEMEEDDIGSEDTTEVDEEELMAQRPRAVARAEPAVAATPEAAQPARVLEGRPAPGLPPPGFFPPAAVLAPQGLPPPIRATAAPKATLATAATVAAVVAPLPQPAPARGASNIVLPHWAPGPVQNLLATRPPSSWLKGPAAAASAAALVSDEPVARKVAVSVQDTSGAWRASAPAPARSQPGAVALRLAAWLRWRDEVQAAKLAAAAAPRPGKKVQNDDVGVLAPPMDMPRQPRAGEQQ